MFKIRRIKTLIIIFLLSIMLFSCEYPMGGIMIQPFYHDFFYEINDNRLLDNKVLIGFGIYIDGNTTQTAVRDASISIYVDNEQSPITCIRFNNEELLSDEYDVHSASPKHPRDYNNITEINLLDYDIKEYIKIVFKCNDDPYNPTYFRQLYIKTTKIDNDFYIYDHELTYGYL